MDSNGCGTNKPTGDSFRSHLGRQDDSRWSYDYDDDHVVLGNRDNSENEYILGDTHFKAFSTEVPKEISDALNLNGINIQAQLDAPYLLSETPGDVAAHWNKIAHFESIDKGTNNINSAIREINSDIKYKSAEEVKLTEQLKGYEYLDAYEQEVEVLEEMEKQKAKLAVAHKSLGNIYLDILNTKRLIKEKSEILKQEDIVNEILSLMTEKKEKELQHKKLYGLTADYYQDSGRDKASE